jgi:hypothetical protein
MFQQEWSFREADIPNFLFPFCVKFTIQHNVPEDWCIEFISLKMEWTVKVNLVFKLWPEEFEHLFTRFVTLFYDVQK